MLQKQDNDIVLVEGNNELNVQMIATEAPPVTYICPHCGAQFATQEELDIHIQTVHPPLILKCFICGLLFTSRESLVSHSNIYHPGWPYLVSVEADKTEVVAPGELCFNWEFFYPSWEELNLAFGSADRHTIRCDLYFPGFKTDRSYGVVNFKDQIGVKTVTSRFRTGTSCMTTEYIDPPEELRTRRVFGIIGWLGNIPPGTYEILSLARDWRQRKGADGTWYTLSSEQLWLDVGTGIWIIVT